jgi:hypothetical protein
MNVESKVSEMSGWSQATGVSALPDRSFLASHVRKESHDETMVYSTMSPNLERTKVLAQANI